MFIVFVVVFVMVGLEVRVINVRLVNYWYMIGVFCLYVLMWDFL